MNFRSVSYDEAVIRRWVGAGRRLVFPDGFFQITLMESVSASVFYPLQSAHGIIELTNADQFLQRLASLPLFPEALNAAESWFFELINKRLRPEFIPLFSFLSEPVGNENTFIGLTLTLQIGSQSDTFTARVTPGLLTHWMSGNLLQPVKSEFGSSFPLSIPLIAGQLTLSAGRVRRLQSGDVLIPTEPMMNVSGEGIMMLGKHQFYYELEPEQDNSHQYLLSITNKQGPESMTQTDNELSEFATGAEHEGDLIQTTGDAGFDDLPLELTIRCGNLSLTLGELQNLDTGSTLLVEHVTPGEALLCHGNYLLAKGELVNVNGALGLQIKSMFRAMPV